MSMIQVMYRSRCRSGLADDASIVGPIVKSSIRNNQRDGLTGFLIAAGEWFVQILEGKPEVVQSVLERISQDDRHYELVEIARREITVRAFAEWSMGCSTDSLARRALFKRHGIGGTFNASELAAPTLFSLAMDLQFQNRFQGFAEAAGGTPIHTASAPIGEAAPE